MTRKPILSRRGFLYGAGGVAVGLPFLEGLQPRKLRAAPPERPRFAVFVRQANGCAQADNGEPEQFWPSQLGAITKESLTADSDRAVSELAEFADQLLMVRGTRFAFPGNGCGHSGGGNQVLTAQKVSDDPSGNLSLAMGESVDNRIARELNPKSNPEPLATYAGAMGGYINEVLSYRGPKDLRAADRNPWSVYTKMVGITTLPEEVIQQIKTRRTSVNDLLKEQMSSLMSSPKLSKDDQDRLQLHFDAIRDIEVELSCQLPPQEEQDAMAAQMDYSGQDDRMQTIVMMHMNLIALAFACDYTRTATLQIGDGNDGTEYLLDGVKFPRYHQISHRIYSDGSEGDPIPDALGKHHRIDREHARMFAHLLQRLAMYTTDTGTLLGDSVAVWCNDLGAGVSHTYNNIPWVCAGSCGGFLKTGQYIDAGDVTHNKFHNTILSAVGLTNVEGNFVDDFGDPELEPGVIDGMIAV
ncbi:DUF1552 domain-containing protein [Nannocystis sp.]|uniref:DUF1552 domain-containing protein n=1 Tax=Nannocystis sp. TaxID=1962667 RepID=UPI0025E84634|nr:DUF1552 domain-containing protein [Nannocystis sp.]